MMAVADLRKRSMVDRVTQSMRARMKGRKEAGRAEALKNDSFC